MATVDDQAIKDYINRRKNELFQHVMGLSNTEAQTHQLRGAFVELKRLEKQVETHFANPEGRNANS